MVRSPEIGNAELVVESNSKEIASSNRMLSETRMLSISQRRLALSGDIKQTDKEQVETSSWRGTNESSTSYIRLASLSISD